MGKVSQRRRGLRPLMLGQPEDWVEEAASPEAKPFSLQSCLPREPGVRLCTLGSSNPPAHSLCLSLELLQRVRKKSPEKLLLYCDSGSLPSLLFPAKPRRSPALLEAGGERSGRGGGGSGERRSPRVLSRADPRIIKGGWAGISQRISFSLPSRPLFFFLLSLPRPLLWELGRGTSGEPGKEEEPQSRSPVLRLRGVNSNSAA